VPIGGKKPGQYLTPGKKKNKSSSLIHGPGWVRNVAKQVNPKAKKHNGKGMPIDSQGRIDLSQLAAQRLNFLDQYNQQVADINRNYEVQRQRAMENEPYVQRGILSDYAGRGMAHSTGFGSAAGRETQLFNQNLGDLAYAHTYGLQDLNTQRTAMARTLRTQRQAVRQAAADRMAAQAGTLGLYTGQQHIGHKKAARLLGLNNGKP
jgi:hypothetical protein